MKLFTPNRRSFISAHIQSMLVLLQVFLQRKASLSNTLASLWLRGWWNALRRSLVTGSIGPRFLSAARRVLDMGRLDSAASTLSDIGPAGRSRGCCQIHKSNSVATKKSFCTQFTFLYVVTVCFYVCAYCPFFFGMSPHTRMENVLNSSPPPNMKLSSYLSNVNVI